MSSKIVETLGKGIYRTESGAVRVVVSKGDRKHGGREETTFPAGTGLKEMKDWQTETRAMLLRQGTRVARGSLERDAEVYLEKPAVKALVSYKSRVCNIKAWYPRFGSVLRHLITQDQIEDQMEKWRQASVADWTRRHRLNALRDLFTKLDGLNARNPAREVKQPKKPQPIPRALPFDVIRTTLAGMRPTATKAFLGVMAFCGFRPVEVRRVKPYMIGLDAMEPDESTGASRPAPSVIRPSAKGGNVVAVAVPDEGVEAWKLWLRTNEWNDDKQKWRLGSLKNANRDWQKAMARVQKKLRAQNKFEEAARYEPVPCYSLVHSYCTTLLVDGEADITVVQKARGHKDVRTTQVYTTMRVDPRLARAVKKAFNR